MFLTLHAGSSRRDDRGRGALAAESVEVGCVGPAVPRLAAHGLRLLMDSPHHHVGAACRGSGKGEGSGREERGVREKREQRGAPVVAESPTANALPCERAESQWKGSNVRRARARLLLDEGADLFGAALTQVPHTGTHQAKIAAA